MTKPISGNRGILFLLTVSAVATIWSGIRPYEYGIWFFELLFGFAGVAVLAATYRRFRFSSLVYVLVAVHFVILAVGAKYTYAEMPLFNWLRDAFGLSRNHYDRVGHLAQGFFPAIIAREIFLRKTRLVPGKMLSFITISVCLALSAFYEIIEWWWAAAFEAERGQEWLGMQGDVWDAQWDMFLALCGATLALVVLSRLHDRSIAALERAQTR